MKRKKPFYIVVNLFLMDDSCICTSATEVAFLAGVHRNTIDPTKTKIYGNYLVKPYKLK